MKEIIALLFSSLILSSSAYSNCSESFIGHFQYLTNFIESKLLLDHDEANCIILEMQNTNSMQKERYNIKLSCVVSGRAYIYSEEIEADVDVTTKKIITMNRI